MPATPLDSAIYRDLMGDADVAKLFTDSADVRAMLLVQGALARVQGDIGMIPKDSAAAIHRASLEVQIDPAGLAAETGQSAVVVPALVAAFRKAMQAPEHAQFVHWGATSQDIMDTALVLRLRQVVAIYETRLKDVIQRLGALAQQHADLPMAGRTYGQVATPTSFGAVVASWGAPLIRHLERLEQSKPRLLQVSLSGAAGTLSAMGKDGPAVRAALAKTLDLNDPQGSWHSTRDTIAEFSAWVTLLAGSLGKIGEDLLLLTQSGIGEVRLAKAGGSSTMPQKTNPVQPTLLVALARQIIGLNSIMQGATLHRQQRDGAAWFTEWMSLPQICLGTARSLSVAQDLVASIRPDSQAMVGGIDDGLGLIYAEALSFALAKQMPRPDAQAAVKTLCRAAQDTQTPLAELACAKWPDGGLEGLFAPATNLGTAPDDARNFAKKAHSV
ncbi:MAG: adenylosuccinate lyase family protein [Marinosulfonomonas sp.]|nr:adenylosuccinate lyase family protein [Marinosulfonomonas sp.]